MTRSTVSPESIFIRKIENNTTHLLIRWNVKEITIDDDIGSHIEYEYDEQKLTATIPDDVMTPNDLQKWITENSSDLLNQAKSMTTSVTEAPKKTNDIRDMSIAEVRDAISE